MKKELHLYDWDGTLFRSPEPTPGWGDREMWWRELGSLSPPCVPKAPDASWYNGALVAKAKKSIGDAEVLAVMATGRRTHFGKRLTELIAAGGMRGFDVVAPKPGGRTEAFKTALLLKLLDKHPTIEKVVIYDDRAPHLAGFKAALEARGLTVETTHIRIKAKPALCEVPSPARVATRFLAA